MKGSLKIVPRPSHHLERVVGVPGAVLLGLGSIVGTGIFVSIGIAASVSGTLTLPAVLLASLLATCNGLSSAQLAAVHPVSGGTYEYGYRMLHPVFGFIAGWMFLCAKAASAAAAALGLAGYLLRLVFEVSPLTAATATGFGASGALGVRAFGLGAIVAIGAVVASGLRRSNRINALVVTCSVGSLVLLVSATLAHGTRLGTGSLIPRDWTSLREMLHASALMFVAYTGYGRIATLGEEIREPARNIPRAMVWTLATSLAIYLGVTWAALALLGAPGLAQATVSGAGPIAVAAGKLGLSGLSRVISVGALLALVGVLLNLILGLSRVVFAMARRKDLPPGLARIDPASGTPRRAVVFVVVVILGIASLGRIDWAWSLSALTVLVYYAMTNLAALRLPESSRRYPRWIAAVGLVGCLSLIFFIPRETGLLAGGIGALGLLGWAVQQIRRVALSAGGRQA